MSLFTPNTAAYSSLQGKVVVISGGATGIGAATTRHLHAHGARIVIGDINIAASEALVEELRTSPVGTITFVPCNVTVYTDIFTLFKTAHDQHGHIDHAISSAGIFETGSWFDPALTIDSVGTAGPGPTNVLDVNVLGTANFSRVAVVFLREGMGTGRGEGHDRSLTLMSSVNAFRDSPGVYMYQTSKHAVQGLMRSMRKLIYERDGVRVNCVCPGVTDTQMTKGIIDTFKEQGLFWQSAEAVAEIIAGIVVQDGMNGKAIYIEGGEGWEFEDSVYATQKLWLGEEATRRMRVNSEAVQKGALTRKKE